MAKTTKPSAASRTVDMFAVQAPEPEERTERNERITIEEDVDRMRQNAFTGQEWTSKFFARPEAEGNEYRVSKNGSYYYVESILKTKGSSTGYGYTGIMVHEADLYNLVTVLVQAVRDKQAKETK